MSDPTRITPEMVEEWKALLKRPWPESIHQHIIALPLLIGEWERQREEIRQHSEETVVAHMLRRELEADVERLKSPITDAYACQRCGRQDGLDAVIPNQKWAQITEGRLLTDEVVDGKWNVLCLWCIDQLCKTHGIECSASLHFCGEAVCGGSDSDANREHVVRLVAEIEKLKQECCRRSDKVRRMRKEARDYKKWKDFNTFMELLETIEKLTPPEVPGHKLTVSIEAMAPGAMHSVCGKGKTVAEAVASLREMVAKKEEP